MTALISIRLSDKLFQDMKAKAQEAHLSQTEYIRQAIELMNEKIEKKEREQRLKQASLQVREESMKVNDEWGKIEHDPEA